MYEKKNLHDKKKSCFFKKKQYPNLEYSDASWKFCFQIEVCALSPTDWAYGIVKYCLCTVKSDVYILEFKIEDEIEGEIA